MRKWMVLLLTLACVPLAVADILVGFDFYGYAGDEETGTSTVTHTYIQTCYITRGAGLNAANNLNRFNANQWTVGGVEQDAVDNNDYFTWTINAVGGASFDVTNIVFNWQRSSTGPSNAFLRSSVDGFASDLASWDVTANGNYSADLSSAGLTNLATIEFRFYGYQAGGSSGSGGFEGSGDDLVVNGTAVIPEPSTLALISLAFGGLAVSRRLRRR